MNKIIRHAPSDKSLKIGQARPLTKEGIHLAIDYGKTLEEKYSVWTSPKPRAIMTGMYIQEGQGGNHGFLVLDDRLDMANFQSGYKPSEVGAEEATKHIIENCPQEMCRTSSAIVDYMLSNFRESNSLGVTHEIPINVLLYVLGINYANSPTQKELSGFSYEFRLSGGVYIRPDSTNNTILFSGSQIEKIAQGKADEVIHETRI